MFQPSNSRRISLGYPLGAVCGVKVASLEGESGTGLTAEL